MTFWWILLFWINGRSICGSDLSPPCKQHNRGLAGVRVDTSTWLGEAALVKPTDGKHLTTFWFCLKQHFRFVSNPDVYSKVFGENRLSLGGLC